MAFAVCDQYRKVLVDVDAAGWIALHVDAISIHIHPEEAPRVRDDLTRAITEVATAAAKAVEGEAA